MPSRVTLTMPTEIYDELVVEAEKRGATIKEVTQKCLKFGLLGLKIDSDPTKEILIRKNKLKEGGIEEETILLFL